MKRKKWIKVLSLLFSVMLLCVGVVGCTKDNGEEKYDAQIKVKSSLGDVWIFDLETSTYRVEYEYTGDIIKIYADSYNMPYHPEYSGWYDYGHNSLSCIDKSMFYIAPNEIRGEQFYGQIKEKGEYWVTFQTGGTMLKFRSWTLFVTIV